MHPASRLEALQQLDADNADQRIASAERSKSYSKTENGGRPEQRVKFLET